jgi:uracil phosphoribosyltransferase
MKMTDQTGTTEATKMISNDDMGPNVHISKHPMLFHKISILRSSATTSGTFRSVLKEITYHLGYEATKDLVTCQVPISVPVGKEQVEQHFDAVGHKISDQTAMIPIMRSGLGMCDSMLELLPKSAVHHIGMYRMPGCAPVQYFNKLPRKCACDVAFVLDPVMGSAATVMAVVAILKKVRCDTDFDYVCMQRERERERLERVDYEKLSTLLWTSQFALLPNPTNHQPVLHSSHYYCLCLQPLFSLFLN